MAQAGAQNTGPRATCARTTGPPGHAICDAARLHWGAASPSKAPRRPLGYCATLRWKVVAPHLGQVGIRPVFSNLSGSPHSVHSSSPGAATSPLW